MIDQATQSNKELLGYGENPEINDWRKDNQRGGNLSNG